MAAGLASTGTFRNVAPAEPGSPARDVLAIAQVTSHPAATVRKTVCLME